MLGLDIKLGCGEAQPSQIAVSGGRLASPSQAKITRSNRVGVRQIFLVSQSDMHSRMVTPALPHSSEQAKSLPDDPGTLKAMLLTERART
ncbi:hypothetical protein, partial [Bradyrhizobium sp.]|uniref:hypothetical protein n=1 Tax=Bradyrhizobium sp. TaxID=376 RepID=UPI003C6F5690